MELFISLVIVTAMYAFVHWFEKWAEADKRKTIKP